MAVRKDPTASLPTVHISSDLQIGNPPARFTRRERHQIFHSLYLRFSEIINRMENVSRSMARALWREVVVSWLRCQGLIDVNLNPKLLPYFAPFCAQN